MAKKQAETSGAASAAPEPAPQPTHGGVYELVDGGLKVIEGGPPQADAPGDAAQPAGEGA